MSTGQILLLGAIAGSTIFIGLPIGRVQNASIGPEGDAQRDGHRDPALPALRRARATASTPVDDSLKAAVHHGGSWGDFVGLAALLAVGFGVGLLSLVYYDRWMARERAKSLLGPGAASAAEFEPSWIHGMSSAALARAPDRDRHRPAQLRRGPRDRPVRRARRDEPRARPDHRLRAPQRHRGLRHRRAARRRHRAAELALPDRARPDRRRPDLPRHARRPGVDEHRGLRRASSRSRPARSSTSSCS